MIEEFFFPLFFKMSFQKLYIWLIGMEIYSKEYYLLTINL